MIKYKEIFANKFVQKDHEHYDSVRFIIGLSLFFSPIGFLAIVAEPLTVSNEGSTYSPASILGGTFIIISLILSYTKYYKVASWLLPLSISSGVFLSITGGVRGLYGNPDINGIFFISLAFLIALLSQVSITDLVVFVVGNLIFTSIFLALLHLGSVIDFYPLPFIFVIMSGSLVITIRWLIEDFKKRIKSSQEETEVALVVAEKAVGQALNANQAKDSFLASTSHELRTPLNAIIGFSDIMLQDSEGGGEMIGSLNDEQYNLLSQVKKSGSSLLRLINDILDISKMESGSLELSLEDDVPVKALLKETFDSVISILLAPGVEFEISGDEALIKADKSRLKQIFLNILSNSAKFTHEGKISVNIQRKEEIVDISITDTGSGINPSEYHKVFDRFTMTQSGLSSGKGTGLGMPIAKKLVEGHQGRIWFESKLDQGTIFFIQLPINLNLDI